MPTTTTTTTKAEAEADEKQAANRMMQQQERNHRLLAITFHAVNQAVPIVVTEHVISVPLHHNHNRNPKEEEQEQQQGDGGGDRRLSRRRRLDVYFTIVEKLRPETQWLYELQLQTILSSPQERAALYVTKSQLHNADGLFLYLQGGPGFGAPAPMVGLGFGSREASWAAAALETPASHSFHRIVLLDQRGCGRSTPVTKQWLETEFPDLFLLDSSSKENNIDITEKLLSTAMTTKDDDDKLDIQQRVQTAVDQVVDFLSCFRCDSIVRDAELVREALLLPPEDDEAIDDDDNNNTDNNNTNKINAKKSSSNIPNPQNPSPVIRPRPWGGALGQSFGGFCLLHYLSFVEHPPKIALFTGGIPPMLTPLYEVYDKLWDRVKERTLRYYDLYPNDVPLVKKIVRRLLLLEQQPVLLPSGGRLTARRFLQLGLRLGSSPSSFATLHNLLANAILENTTTGGGGVSNGNEKEDGDEEVLVFRRSFLKEMELEQSFDDHPIYFWLHEPSCYADGGSIANGGATNWTAHRVYEDKKKNNNNKMSLSNNNNDGEWWDYRVTCQESDPRPVLWFGEHVFPWMVEDYAELRGVGLAAVAEALAQKADWGPLFHADNIRAALQSNKCRAAAAVYYEDMYVEFDASIQLTKRGAPLEKCLLYITNEYQHSGLRDDGAKIFAKLYGMATGSIRTPS